MIVFGFVLAVCDGMLYLHCTRIVFSANNVSTHRSLDVCTRAGALFNMLKPFQEFKINLNRIESRPSNKGEYCFEMALDFNGDIRNTKVQVRVYTMRTRASVRMRTQPALCQTEMLGMLCVRWCVECGVYLVCVCPEFHRRAQETHSEYAGARSA